MKYYAVKRGRETGVFEDWEKVKTLVNGFPGASFKSFATDKEAKRFLETDETENAVSAEKTAKAPERKTAIAYTDGSYNPETDRAGYGVIMKLGDGSVERLCGSVKSLGSRQITGETTAVMLAVTMAVIKNMKKIEIRYDYEGVEKWVTGEWSAEAQCAVEYSAFMKKMSKHIKFEFVKIAAHTGEAGNERADALAKMGCGVT